MAFNNPQQVLYRRGSRILPENLDRRKPTTRIEGTVVAVSGNVTVVAFAGQVVTGTVTAQSQQASARALAPDALPPVAAAGPQFAAVQRRDRRLVYVDEAVYKNVLEGEKEGVVGALSSPATVVAVGTRTITGAVSAISQSATALATTPESTGFASAQSGPATVSATGTLVSNVSVAAASRPATVFAVGKRIITGTASVSSGPAQALAVGALAGLVVGSVAAQSQSATTTIFASRGFTGTVAAQSQPATTNIVGERIQPDPPVFENVDTLLSRVWRDLVLDFSRYLRQGDEPITYSVVTGSLPPGLTLEPTTGVVSGKPTTIGFYDLQIQATNIAGSSNTDLFRWLISDTIPKNGTAVNQNVVSISGI